MSIRAIVDGLGELELDDVRLEEERLERALIVVRAVRTELERRGPDVTVTLREAGRLSGLQVSPVTAAAAAVAGSPGLRAMVEAAALEEDRRLRTAAHGDTIRPTAFPLVGVDELRPDLDDVVRCAECGCTDLEACPGGCWWVQDPTGQGRDVCSRCVDSVEPRDPDAAAEGTTSLSRIADPDDVDDVLGVEQDDEPPAPATSSSQADPAPATVDELITPRELEDLPRTAAGGIDLNLGAPAERAARRDRALLAVYRANAGRWLSNLEVSSILGISTGSVSTGARALVDDGRLEHNGKGGAHGRYRAPLLEPEPAGDVDELNDRIDAAVDAVPDGDEAELDAGEADRETELEAQEADVVGREVAGIRDLITSPPPGPRPAAAMLPPISPRVRKLLSEEEASAAADERARRREELERQASTNGADPELPGRVLECLGYMPDTISGIANRLRIPDDHRAALAVTVAKLADDGDLIIDRSRPGPRVYAVA